MRKLIEIESKSPSHANDILYCAYYIEFIMNLYAIAVIGAQIKHRNFHVNAHCTVVYIDRTRHECLTPANLLEFIFQQFFLACTAQSAKNFLSQESP